LRLQQAVYGALAGCVTWTEFFAFVERVDDIYGLNEAAARELLPKLNPHIKMTPPRG
jgi:hypothetical protein